MGRRVFLSLSQQALCWQGLESRIRFSKGFLDASNSVSKAETGGCSLGKQALILQGMGDGTSPDNGL